MPEGMPGEDKSPSCPGWNTAAKVTPKQAAIQLVTRKMPKVHAAVRPMPVPASPSAQTDAIIQPATSGKTSIFRLLIISSPSRPSSSISRPEGCKARARLPPATPTTTARSIASNRGSFRRALRILESKSSDSNLISSRSVPLLRLPSGIACRWFAMQ